MDAHLFRRFCDDFIPALIGVRIEKIHQITSGVVVFTLYGLGKFQGDTSLFGDKKQYLILKSGRDPLLFLSEHRPTIGTHPPAFIMRLRKHCAGQRIMQAQANWIERKMYLQMHGGAWLCLDLKNGIELYLDTEPEIDISQPIWPDFDFIYAACVKKHLPYQEENIRENLDSTSTLSRQKNEFDEANKKEIWRQYPILTPLLRNTLPYIEKEEGAALYADLQYGGGDVTVYTLGEEKLELSPWLLPYGLLQKMGFASLNSTTTEEEKRLEKQATDKLVSNNVLSNKTHTNTKMPYKELLFEDAISALKYAGSIALTRLSQALKNAITKPLLTEAKRLDKLTDKLQKEEERLQDMLAKKDDALLLQAHLYDLDSKAKQKSITLADTLNSENERTINLDPAKTIGENMEYFFHVAARGKRGLAHLATRLENLALQKKQALQNVLEESALQKGFENQNTQKKLKYGQKITQKYGQKQDKNQESNKITHNKGTQFNQKDAKKQDTTKASTKNLQKFPPQVQAFRSTDGFLILRGRDTKGNGLVLKMANPHDYWVHIAQGASAHIIIRRDHPDQDVPQQTMEEAGCLALLKSWQKEQDKGLVQYSLAKYIRPMKAGKGMVHVDKSEGTYLVKSHTNLEDELSI